MIALRTHLGINQTTIGLAAGITRFAIAAIEHQDRRVSLGEAVAIATALGVDLPAMYGPDPIVLTATRTVHID